VANPARILGILPFTSISMKNLTFICSILVLSFGVLTPLSAIFQLYHGGQF
jgi:hypothetical protein